MSFRRCCSNFSLHCIKMLFMLVLDRLQVWIWLRARNIPFQALKSAFFINETYSDMLCQNYVFQELYCVTKLAHLTKKGCYFLLTASSICKRRSGPIKRLPDEWSEETFQVFSAHLLTICLKITSSMRYLVTRGWLLISRVSVALWLSMYCYVMCPNTDP